MNYDEAAPQQQNAQAPPVDQPLLRIGPGGDFVRELWPKPEVGRVVRVELPRAQAQGWQGFWSGVRKAVGRG